MEKSNAPLVINVGWPSKVTRVIFFNDFRNILAFFVGNRFWLGIAIRVVIENDFFLGGMAAYIADSRFGNKDSYVSYDALPRCWVLKVQHCGIPTAVLKLYRIYQFSTLRLAHGTANILGSTLSMFYKGC